jgi:hypothetical protein
MIRPKYLLGENVQSSPIERGLVNAENTIDVFNKLINAVEEIQARQVLKQS